ncbi:MAG: BamA/TamA family outer membrane protein, partial [Myxococcales bacterium]|nr:BamA/TamA family outer membrane protein [Myxococcales bacterium]
MKSRPHTWVSDRRNSACAAICALLVGICGASPALAEQDEREVPDYDGREDEAPDAGEVLIWVPRIVFSPVYAVTEYLIRKPLGAFLTWLEREHVLERMAAVFTLGTGGEAGLLPTFFYEFNFRPSVGLYFWLNHFVTDTDRLRIHFAWGGEDWWRFTVRHGFDSGAHEDDPLRQAGMEDAQAQILARNRFEYGFVLDYRPDRLFYGLGPHADQPSRYGLDRLGAYLQNDFFWHDYNRFGASATYWSNRFEEGDPDRDDNEVQTAALFADNPEALENYQLAVLNLSVDLDSRDPRPAPGSGVRTEVFADYALDPSNSALRFLRYGGRLSLFLDITGRNNVIAIRQYVANVTNLGDDQVPFPELLIMGGPELLRGFKAGRYHGAS